MRVKPVAPFGVFHRTRFFWRYGVAADKLKKKPPVEPRPNASHIVIELFPAHKPYKRHPVAEHARVVKRETDNRNVQFARMIDRKDCGIAKVFEIRRAVHFYARMSEEPFSGVIDAPLHDYRPPQTEEEEFFNAMETPQCRLCRP